MYLVWTFAVPGVDPRCTWGAISAGPGRVRPTHGGGLQAVFTFTRGTGLGGRGRLCLARGRGSGPGPGTPATGRPVPGREPAGSAQPACVGLPRCRRGGPPAGFPGLGRDGQQNWQTV
jgi:hypothetical protein